MKKGLRGFLAFSPMAYRIFAWLVFPCLILAMRILIGLAGSDDGSQIEAAMAGADPVMDGSQIEAVIMGAYLVMLELISDYWLFGGVCSKEMGCPVYLKTSQSGINLFRNGLIWDLVRRFVWIMLYSGISYAVCRQPGELVNGLLMYVVVAAGLNLTRHQQVFQYMMLVSTAAVMVYVLLRIPGLMLEAIAWAAEAAGIAGISVTTVVIAEAALYMVLCVVVSALTIWHMMACQRERGEKHEK